MEIFFVYGLVLIFFILVPIFVVFVLSQHPYAQSSESALTAKRETAQVSSSFWMMPSKSDKTIVYAFLAAILIGLCMITVLNERSSPVKNS
jgi:hypothetical protein